MGNQLYIYGGVTAQGISTELWAYNLVSQTWALVAPSSPAPGLPAGAGTTIGSHFYVWTQDRASSAPGQLWRWRPAPPSGFPQRSSSSGYTDATAAGHTAGIVLGLLLALGNLYVLARLAQNGSVDLLPGVISRLLGMSSSSAKAQPAGFY